MLRKIARLVIVICLVFGAGMIKMGCDCECVGESTPCSTTPVDTNSTCTVYIPPPYSPDPQVCIGCQPIFRSPVPGMFYQPCEKTGVGFVNGDDCDTCDPDCRYNCGEKWISDVICSEKPINPIEDCVTVCLYRRG